MEAAAPPAGRILEPEREGPLRRAISRRMLLFFVIGDIIGAGIYALVGAVGGEVGGAIWTAFTVALFVGILVAGGIYFLVTFLASAVVPTDQLAGSSGPLLEVIREGSDIPPRLFSFIALLAVANGALINMIMASRLLYGMANERVLPDPFARVHPERRTPWVAIVFTTALAMILISIGRLDDLAFTTVMLLLVVFAMVNVAVLVLRREPVDRPHFVAPVIFPVFGLVISIVLLVKRFVDMNSTQAYILLLLVGMGIALWLVNHFVYGRTTKFDPARLEP